MAEAANLNRMEQESPLQPNSVCVTLYDFEGSADSDLPFKEGEELRILEPSKEMFWYVARNSQGRTGTVPVTFLKEKKESDPPRLPAKPMHLLRRSSEDTPPPTPTKSPFLSALSFPRNRPIPEYLQIQDDSSVPPPLPARKPDLQPLSHTLPRFNRLTPEVPPPSVPICSASIPTPVESIDHRPPMPLPHQLSVPGPKTSACIQVGKYPTIQAFREQSGWFKPAPDIVLANKILVSPQVFRSMTCGVYYFQHKFKMASHYVGYSLKLCPSLVSMFERLYEKKVENLNNLERELRFNSPDSNDWNVSLWTCHADNIELELSKKIVSLKTLPPCGLNESLDFVSRKHFRAFCEWYTEYRVSNKETSTRSESLL